MGWYGQGDGGHSHDQLRAEEVDGVLPPVAILLLLEGTASHGGPTQNQSLKTEILS